MEIFQILNYVQFSSVIFMKHCHWYLLSFHISYHCRYAKIHCYRFAIKKTKFVKVCGILFISFKLWEVRSTHHVSEKTWITDFLFVI